MHTKTFFCIISVIFLLSWRSNVEAKSLPVVQVGIVRDGPSELVPELRDLIQKEILELTRGEFEVRFPNDLQFDGGWSVQGVKQAIDHVLAQPRVNLVIALGILASQEVSQRRQLPKPVIAPLILDPHLQGLPFKKGTSGMKNLSYLVTGKGFERDLEAFKEVFPFTRLTLLADRVLLEAFPPFKDRARKIAETHGVKLTFVPVETSAEAAVGSIPADTEAVYLSPLPRLLAGEFDRLVLALNRRKLPSFSAVGQRDVQRGITVALSPELDLGRFARTIAANVQRILSGTDAGRLEVAFVRGEQLAINMATVRAIDKWPSFQVLSEAELVNEDAAGASRRLSLFDAVRESADANLDLVAASRKVAAGIGQVGQARSGLLPQVFVGTSGVLNGRGPDTFGTGGTPGQAAVALGGFRQLLYSDDAWTKYTVQQKTQLSREEEWNQLRLDIGQDAAVAYLTVLRTKTARRIQKDNLKLTRSNLDLATAREAVGYALRDEVFRWEAEVANGQKAVVSAEAQERQAEVDLNRILNRPLEEKFQTVEQTLEDPGLLGDTRQLFAYVENPRGFQVFRDFEVEEGIQAAPELRRLDALSAAQERTVTNAQRAYWLPEVAIQGAGFQQYAQGGGGAGSLTVPLGPVGFAQTQNNFYVASIGLTFPLFQGGYKDATALKAREELRQVQFERAAVAQQVEERVRTTLYQTGASFPSIRLSRKAAESARKTLDLVVDQYSRGAVDIIKLLNSQNAALTANQAAANAVYEFLIDLAKVQRAVGQMSFFRSSEERAAWFERLKTHFVNAGVSPVLRDDPRN
ncbi:MAG: TolC family protein [Planctomycetaceae bacterium]|nr:TolC family protein [Planctomycetaceae bacterium]